MVWEKINLFHHDTQHYPSSTLKKLHPPTPPTTHTHRKKKRKKKKKLHQEQLQLGQHINYKPMCNLLAQHESKTAAKGAYNLKE